MLHCLQVQYAWCMLRQHTTLKKKTTLRTANLTCSQKLCHKTRLLNTPDWFPMLSNGQLPKYLICYALSLLFFPFQCTMNWEHQLCNWWKFNYVPMLHANIIDGCRLLKYWKSNLNDLNEVFHGIQRTSWKDYPCLVKLCSNYNKKQIKKYLIRRSEVYLGRPFNCLSLSTKHRGCLYVGCDILSRDYTLPSGAT